jgi:hypothetical protein
VLWKRTRHSLNLGTLVAPNRFGQGRCLSYADRSHGGRSSARLERQVVALEVGGSSPLGHPIVVVVVRREAGDHRSENRR